MSMKINVEPQALEQGASRMEEQCSSYDKTYRQLYSCVDAMQSAWQGSDNLAYVNQIKGFQKDFNQMVTLMRQYVEFLRQSAKAYRMTQEDRIAQARALTN